MCIATSAKDGTSKRCQPSARVTKRSESPSSTSPCVDPDEPTYFRQGIESGRMICCDNDDVSHFDLFC